MSLKEKLLPARPEIHYFTRVLIDDEGSTESFIEGYVSKADFENYLSQIAHDLDQLDHFFELLKVNPIGAASENQTTN